MLRRFFVLLIIVFLLIPWFKPVAHSAEGCNGAVCSLSANGCKHGEVCPVETGSGEHGPGHDHAARQGHRHMDHIRAGEGSGDGGKEKTSLNCGCHIGHDSPFSAFTEQAYLLKYITLNSCIGPSDAISPLTISYKGPDEGLPDRPPVV